MFAVFGIVVAVAFGLAMLGVRSWRRRRHDPLLRRSRALTALTRIAETASGPDVMLAYPVESMGNVRLIERRHERHSRAHSRRSTRVARDETVLNRPTIAVLPTPREPHHGKPSAQLDRPTPTDTSGDQRTRGDGERSGWVSTAT